MASRFIRFPELQNLVGLSRSTVWRLESQGLFPSRRKGARNVVGWLEHEVKEWILGRSPVASKERQ